MRKINLMLLALVFAFCLNGCEVAEPTLEGTELLANTWVVRSVYIDGQKDIVTNYDAFVLRLHADKRFEMTDIYGVTEEGTWQILNNNTRLVLNAGTDQEKRYRIVEISANELTLLFEDLYFKDIVSVFRYELMAQ